VAIALQSFSSVTAFVGFAGHVHYIEREKISSLALPIRKIPHKSGKSSFCSQLNFFQDTET